MRRIFCEAGVSLLLGVVACYAIAVLCVLVPMGSRTTFTPIVFDDGWQGRYSGHRTSGYEYGFAADAKYDFRLHVWHPDAWGRRDGVRPRHVPRTAPSERYSPTNGQVVRAEYYFVSGWPMRAVVARVPVRPIERNKPSPAPDMTRLYGGVLIDGKWRGLSSGQTVMPLQPIPLGFVLNVTSWGSLAWLILFGPRRLRQWRRARRGLCPSCGYDLASSPSVCPECGWALVHAVG